MSHLDAERLALLALGEPADERERGHLDDCAACAGELDELAFAVSVGRSAVDMGSFETPPERVWQGILAEIGATPPPAATPDRVPPSLRGDDTPPATARSTQRRRILYTLAASVALLLAIVGIGVALRPAGPVELATATLDAFPQHPGAHGTATVWRDDGEERSVQVTLDADAADDDGYREVWLITADASALVSLGTLEGSEGIFRIPDDVDIRDYVLVDVSLEPEDGDPAHSGDSIVRGELRPA